METSEMRELFLIIIVMVVWLSLILTSKYDYNYRCRIPKWMNIFFWNKAKNETVPFLAIVGTILLYIMVPLLLIMNYINPELDLGEISVYYLFIPWLVIMPLILLYDGIASYKKKKRIKAEEEARTKRKKDNWIANNVKKKKK